MNETKRGGKKENRRKEERKMTEGRQVTTGKTEEKYKREGVKENHK